MQTVKQFVLITICTFLTIMAKAQTDTIFRPDSLCLKIDSVESLFLQKNLLLLAQRYNIDAQKALVVQAKLFPNPTFSFGTPIYQTNTKQYFPIGEQGEISAGLSQLILLANKHNDQIKIARTNAVITEYQFYDLLRTLKHTLRTDFFNVHYLLESAKVYDKEIGALKQVNDAFAKQNGKGYISEKEVIRVKAQLYSLQSEYNDLKNQINDLQSELRLLVQTRNLFIIPDVDTAALAALNPAKYSLSMMIDSACESRPDLKIAKLNIDLSTQNYQLEKAKSVPDLTLQFGYDQQGGYVHNLATVGLGVDLPLFTRNQGSIKSAKALINCNKVSFGATKANIEEQINSALQIAWSNDDLLKGRDLSFEKDFNRLLNEVFKNYEIRNITLLDFLDFYDSYKQNTLQINSIYFNRVRAFEDLDFYTGLDFFKQ